MNTPTIIFDLDGTLTDYNAYVNKSALPYFCKKYGWEPRYGDRLEIEDMLAIRERLMEQGVTEGAALQQCRLIMNQYWVGPRFLKFSLFGAFRPGVRSFLNLLKREGFSVEIHTSRAKTCENNLIGKIARGFTILQCRVRGTAGSKIVFYKDDRAKVQGICAKSPVMVFEDKTEVIAELCKAGVKVVCLAGQHNQEITDNKEVKRVTGFEDPEALIGIVKELIGREKWNYGCRAGKSDAFFKRLLWMRGFVMRRYKPLILHEENLVFPSDKPVIYAPNHRSTLDPVVFTAFMGMNIHWAALKRFFTAEDSIFNNNKNVLLCRMTSKLFYGLEFFPIVRKSDNPDANNFAALRDMKGFLKANQAVGIFAEGTTRRPAGAEFGTFDPAFFQLAKRTGALVQPITFYWTPTGKNKVVINVGRALAVKDAEEDFQNFLEIQQRNLEEIKSGALEKS